MKFRDHKYTWTHMFTSIDHTWQFRGPDGGIHFRAHVAAKPGEYSDSAGLEFHHNFQPYGEPEAAHHAPCWLTGQPCWHDGTSLYASETIWPMVKAMMPDHDAIFRLLEGEYEEHFAKLREASDD